MKKSLIALAAVAASGAAFAQSSVTVFGVVDTSVAYEKGDESWSGMQNSGLSTGRLGFRGTEDLGGGLKANFWLEGQVDTDNGGNGFNFKRRSTVGLEGGFGEVRLGRELTAAYNAVARYDVFGDVGYGASLMFKNTVADAHNNRRSNMVTYLSPNFSGFRVNVNYAFGEGTESTLKRGAYFGTGVTYDNGPLSLGLGIERQNTAGVFGVPGFPAVEGVAAANRLTSYAFGGSYDFGVVKLNGAYRLAENRAFGADSDLDGQALLIGLSAPVGAAGVAKISYGHYEHEIAGAEDAKADQLSLGYVHNLSKRTAVYGTYAYLKNKNKGETFKLNGQNSDLDNGKVHAVQVGVRHAF